MYLNMSFLLAVNVVFATVWRFKWREMLLIALIILSVLFSRVISIKVNLFDEVENRVFLLEFFRYWKMERINYFIY